MSQQKHHPLQDPTLRVAPRRVRRRGRGGGGGGSGVWKEWGEELQQEVEQAWQQVAGVVGVQTQSGQLQQSPTATQQQ